MLRARRPISVWIVSTGYLLIVVLAAQRVAMSLVRKPQTNELGVVPLQLSTTALVFWAAGFTVTLAAIASLFFLRRYAVTLFGLSLGVELIGLVAYLLGGADQASEGRRAALAMLPVLVQLALLRFAWRLQREGVLR